MKYICQWQLRCVRDYILFTETEKIEISYIYKDYKTLFFKEHIHKWGFVGEGFKGLLSKGCGVGLARRNDFAYLYERKDAEEFRLFIKEKIRKEELNYSQLYHLFTDPKMDLNDKLFLSLWNEFWGVEF
jgi:hypothetical protein